MKTLIIDIKIKNKIESLTEFGGVYIVKFKGLIDTFWFESVEAVQEFMNVQARERIYEKELRKGYFDETLRYYVKANRGALTVIEELNLGCCS